jgi:hypothetical protein
VGLRIIVKESLKNVRLENWCLKNTAQNVGGMGNTRKQDNKVVYGESVGQ